MQCNCSQPEWVKHLSYFTVCTPGPMSGKFTIQTQKELSKGLEEKRTVKPSPLFCLRGSGFLEHSCVLILQFKLMRSKVNLFVGISNLCAAKCSQCDYVTQTEGPSGSISVGCSPTTITTQQRIQRGCKYAHTHTHTRPNTRARTHTHSDLHMNNITNSLWEN